MTEQQIIAKFIIATLVLIMPIIAVIFYRFYKAKKLKRQQIKSTISNKKISISDKHKVAIVVA